MKTNHLLKSAFVMLVLFGLSVSSSESSPQTEAVFEQNANGQSLGLDSCGTEHFASNNNLWTQSERFDPDCHMQSVQTDVSNWNMPAYPNGSAFNATIGSHSVHLNGSVAMGNLNIDGGGLLNLDANNTGGAQNYSIDVAFNGGTIVNNGSIISIGPNEANQTYHFNVDTLLTGNGSTTFGYDTIVNGPGVLTIDTNQNVIIGGRTILNAAFVNHGTITSDGTSSFNGTNTVAIASPQITNTGTIRTITDGGIAFQASTAIDNTGGTLSASGNYSFNLNYGVSITGGTLAGSADPARADYFSVSGGGATFSNLSLATGTRIFVQGSVLTLNGAIANSGQILCVYNQNPNGPGILNVASDTTLSGNGRINVNYSANNTIASGATLTLGPDQTLDGEGPITGALTNHGLVNSTGTTTGLILKGGNFVNSGTIQASGGSALTFGYFTSFTIDNTGGVIQALDNSVVQFGGVPALVRNGTLTSAGNGYLTSLTSGAAITLENVTNNGQLNLPHGCNGSINLDIAGGSLTNNGHIDDTGFQCNPVRIRSLGDVTINGNGRILFANDSFLDSTDSGVITNGASHTIVSAGRAFINPSLVNNGRTVALESEGYATNLNGPTVTNNGMLQAIGNPNPFGYPAVLQQSGNSTLTNYDSATQTLTGGTYSMLAAPNGAILSLNIGPVVVNNATVILSGPGAQFGPINSIHQNWGTLAVLGGKTFSTTAPSAPAKAKQPEVGDSLANAGTLKLDETSSINVNGNYAQGSNGRLYIEIGADGPNPNFHQLNVSGTATLAGTLDVRLVNGFVPAPNQVFPILSASGISGGFNQVHGADITYTPTGVSIHPNGGAIPLVLTGAASRKTHQAAGAVAGTFDVDLPRTGQPGVECRSGGAQGTHTLVFTFNNIVANGAASVTAGAGSVSGSPVFAPTTSPSNTMIVNLTGITNGQTITITLSNVTDTFGQVLPSAAVNVNMILGDVTGNGAVNSSDVSQAQFESGHAVSTTNFRADVTVNGAINSSDVSTVEAQSGSARPPGTSPPQPKKSDPAVGRTEPISRH